MFHRRNKISAHSIKTRHAGPPQVSAAASSAASLAFLNNQKSNPSLSAAAAATALRSNPHPPTDVANVHTKRLQRRESGSSTSGSPRPGLERRTSLTERTLRSPSPGRDGAATQSVYAPPMPPLPKGVERTPSGRHRAASLEAQPRITSPTPTQPGGRGVSLDRAPKNPASSQAAPPGKPALPHLSEYSELPQRTSVNFSRPMSPPPQNSPTPASPSKGQTGWFAGPVVSGGQPRHSLDSLRPTVPTTLPAAEVSGIQAGLQGVADRPAKKKKKRLSGGGNQGTHLTQGTMELTGTAVASAREAIAAAHESESPTIPSYPASESGRSSIDSASASDASSFADRPEQSKTRAGTLLARQPSLIDEAPEYEQQPERANTSRKVEALAPKSLIDASRVAAASTPAPAIEPQPEPEPEPALVSAPTAQPKPTSVASDSVEPNGVIVQRTASISPPRAAHFSPKPVEYLDGIIHQPPGRSVSPAKSALKHSPSSSVRTSSPDVRFSSTQSSEVGEASALVAKKKANRVSFDETPIIVSGLQTSRFASQSPPRARDMDDDLDDIMKPRPALPSFGSIRGKQPEDKIDSVPQTTNGQPIGHSSDRILGGILVQDFASKESSSRTSEADSTADPPHDPTLPLAPEVTTVEGTGYASDTESDYSEHPSFSPTSLTRESNGIEKEPETISEAVAAIQSTPQSIPQLDITTADRSTSNANATLVNAYSGLVDSTASSVAVPVIAVQPATPAVEEAKEMVMPGAFPGAWDDDAPESTLVATPTVVPQTQAAPVQTSRQSHSILPAAVVTDDNSDSESDTSSIWSDAEEDLPSGPGGFASLNAIMGGTTLESSQGLATSKYAPAQGSSPVTDETPPSPTAARWNEATAYWRSLSEQKKKELEGQALHKEIDAGEIEPEDSSDDDESLGNVPVREIPRPATPPRKKEKKAPKLDSPIELVQSGAVAPSKIRKEPKLRTSMRESKPVIDEEVPRMRTSLRNSTKDQAEPRKSGEHSLRTSMRTSQPRPDPVRRHSSGIEESKWNHQKPTEPLDTVQNGRPRTAGGAVASPASKGPTVPSLKRQDSDDSVSSFRRQRANSTPRRDGIVTMRRSMRGSAAAVAPAPAAQRTQSPPEKRKAGRFSLRSLSPVGREPLAPDMRQTLRSGAGAPTLRDQEPKKKSRFTSPTRLGFGKSKSKVVESPRNASSPAASSAFKSRIRADSDDEDVPTRAFISRFADSDDELDSVASPTGLTPVRGIPRKTGNEDYDSTDLEDSDNERATKVPPVPSLKDVDHAHGKSSVTNGHAATSALTAGSLRKSDNGLGTSKFAPVERPEQKRRLSWLGIGSKRRSSSVPPLSVSSPPPSRGTDGTKPNLLRRSTPTGLPQISEDSTSNWPLAGGSTGRPTTADSSGMKLKQGTMRPAAVQRRSTADYVGSDRTAVEESINESSKKRVGFNFENAEPVYSMRTGRKKKFGTLRRMIGLND